MPGTRAARREAWECAGGGRGTDRVSKWRIRESFLETRSNHNSTHSRRVQCTLYLLVSWAFQ